MAKKKPAKKAAVSKPKAKGVPGAPNTDQMQVDASRLQVDQPAFPSYFAEPTISREEVIERMSQLELPTDSPPISSSSAPFPTDSYVQGTKTGRTGDGSEAIDSGASSQLTGGRAFPTQFPTEVSTDGQSAGETDAADAAGTQDSATPLATELDRTEIVGDIAFSVAADVGSSRSLVVRLPLARARDGETKGQCWERLRRESRAAGMTRRGSVAYAGRQADRLFPAPEPAIVEELPAEPIPELETSLPTVGTLDPPSIPVVSAPIQDDQGVSGLSDLPPSWPELPANAQLQIEIAWVTANRLRVRDGTGVNLSKALSPAPSYSALSWLETSILFPAKFADISVKATADNDNEREFIKREKMAIEEIRSILSEMLEPGEG